ncbi:MAG TPA: FGGY-family carbohydrate kinase [Armatimonadota bacterium]|jgi:xylulokinase
MSLLGVDLGTSMCKAAVFGVDGRCLAQAQREYRTYQPGPGQFELDSCVVWQLTQEVIAEVALSAQRDPITALCVSSFGEAVVPLSQQREILGNSILSADARGAEYVQALADDIGQEAFYRINPNRLGPQYALPKLLWLRDHMPELFGRTEHFLLWGDCVGYLLGGEAVTNNSLANRTLLFDITRNDWSERLLAWSGLERRVLGRVVPGGTVVGSVSDAMAAHLGLPKGVQIVAGGHDQCCNALGCGAITAGKAVCGIGTYECITPTFGPVAQPLAMLAEGLNIEHHVLPQLYVSFLYNQSGALVKWFRDTFAAAEARGNADIYAQLNAEIPDAPTSLLVLPHFDPPQWPQYLPNTAGAILGLHTSTTRGEILKAIMECATLYFVDGLHGLRRMGIDLTECIASGGGARSDAWLQIKADIFGLPFVRTRITEGGLVGAAMLAGLATGVYASPQEAVHTFVRKERLFEPDPQRHAYYQDKHARYRRLYPALAELLAE